MPDGRPDTRVSLPTHVYVVATLFGVLMLGLLTVQLVMINDQRTTTDKQLAIQARQSARALPVLEQTEPLIDQLDGALPEAKRLGESAQELADTATPLLRDLRDARAGENIRAAGSLAHTLLDADVGEATRAGRALARTVLDADLPEATRIGRELAAELLRADLPRMARLVSRVIPEQAQLLQRSVAIQAETLEIQKQALAAIVETLAVAKETERHAESLDNKTGGSGTTGGPPPTEGPLP